MNVTIKALPLSPDSFALVNHDARRITIMVDEPGHPDHGRVIASLEKGYPPLLLTGRFGMRLTDNEPKVCRGCGMWFAPKAKQQRNCSDRCSRRIYRAKKAKT